MPQEAHSPLSFAMLLNLASVVNAETPEILWGFIRRYNPAATPEEMPFLAGLVNHALAYYRDFVRPAKRFRHPDADRARGAGGPCRRNSAALPPDADGEAIQNVLYEVGKRHPFPELRAWFGCLYQVLLGQPEGPRFGQFVALYGIPETIGLIEAGAGRGRRRPEGACDGRAAASVCSGTCRRCSAWCCSVGAVYVVQKEFRALKIEDIARALEAMPAPHRR